MASSVVYRELVEQDAMRILLLKSRRATLTDGRIHCELEYTSLTKVRVDVTLQYAALSYVWGTESNPRMILVDGKEFPVTVNLFSAFKSLQHDTKDFYLWVDAICIDQANVKERNIQMASMGAIYAAAATTIIYLGESDEDSNRAIGMLNALPAKGSSSNPETSKEVVSSQLTISSLLKRAWFSRVWVLQELSLSANPIVQCGPQRVRWQKLATIFGHMHRQIATPTVESLYGLSNLQLSVEENRMMGMEVLRENVRRNSVTQKCSFEDKMKTMIRAMRLRAGLKAKDARDMIFAHVGMAMNDYSWEAMFEDEALSGQKPKRKYKSVHVARRWLAISLAIDYEKPVARLYNEFARGVIAFEGRDIYEPGNVFFDVEKGFPGHRSPGLASWAPDWTLQQRHRMVPLPGRSNPHNMSELSHHPIFCVDSFVLGMHGYSFALVKQVSPIVTSDDVTLLPQHPIPSRIARNNAKYRGQLLVTYRKLYDDWAKKLDSTFLSEISMKNDINWALYGEDELTEFQKYTSSFGGTNVHHVGAPIPRLADYLVQASAQRKKTSMVEGRRVAVLSNGHRSLVPASTKTGDTLCSIPLSPFWVILRLDDSLSDASIEDDLRRESKKTVKSESEENIYASDTLWLLHERPPIQHATVIGSCLVDEHEKLQTWDVGLQEFKKKLVLFALH